MNHCSGILHKVSLSYRKRGGESRPAAGDHLPVLAILPPSGESKPSTWVYRVSLNTALVYRRRTALQQRELTLGADQIADLPAEQREENPQRDALLQAIRCLPKTERMIITLHLDSYSNSEIAAMTGTSKGNIAVKIHRIRETLKKQLKEEK